MLTKLLKYEFKSSARTFGLVYLTTLALCALNGVLALFNGDGNGAAGVAQGIAIFALISFMTAAFIITLVININRFRKGVFQDEGYLLHTLPVRSDEIIAAKLIPALLWTVATAVVSLASYFLLFFLLGSFDLGEIAETLSYVFDRILRTDGWGGLLLALLTLLLTVTQSLLQIYACIAVGQLFQKYKTGIALLTFFVYNTVQTQLMLLFDLPYFSLTGAMFGAYTATGYSDAGVRITDLAVAVGWSALSWLITQLVLARRLNLE